MQPGNGYSLAYSRPRYALRHALVLRAVSVCVTTWNDGYLLGSMMEFFGYAEGLSRARLDALLRGAAAGLHEPEDTELQQEWWGWWPMSVDEMPIIGSTTRWSTLCLAMAHGMLGVSMSAPTGELIAAMLTGGDMPIDPTPYAPARFGLSLDIRSLPMRASIRCVHHPSYNVDMDTFTLQRGRVPLLISLPHDGSFIPDDIAARMHPRARRSPDTDWHVARLYEPLAQALGASVLKPRASRYVVDLNRPADGHALYPGQRETGLVSTVGFDGEPLYLDGKEPDADEVQQRVNTYWRPYHQALAAELSRLCVEHGRAVLWEGHSIRSRVPMLFEGQLPDFNLGTATGASCGDALQTRLQACLTAQSRFSVAINGRFKGGYITRHYGDPEAGVQAVQLELVQLNYMDETSFEYDETKAAAVQALIDQLLHICMV